MNRSSISFHPERQETLLPLPLIMRLSLFFLFFILLPPAVIHASHLATQQQNHTGTLQFDMKQEVEWTPNHLEHIALALAETANDSSPSNSAFEMLEANITDIRQDLQDPKIPWKYWFWWRQSSRRNNRVTYTLSFQGSFLCETSYARDFYRVHSGLDYHEYDYRLRPKRHHAKRDWEQLLCKRLTYQIQRQAVLSCRIHVDFREAESVH